MKTLFVCLFLALSFSCATKIKRYEGQVPQLVLEHYFNGKMTAHGLVMNRSGEVTRRFEVKLNTIWNGNVGTLTEDFLWNNNEKTQRVWTITKISDGIYEGRASDILGIAKGESAGNAFHWTYKMNLPVDDSTYLVSFNDWMFLSTEKILINQAKISWFGIHAGEVLISFSKD